MLRGRVFKSYDSLDNAMEISGRVFTAATSNFGLESEDLLLLRPHCVGPDQRIRGSLGFALEESVCDGCAVDSVGSADRE